MSAVRWEGGGNSKRKSSADILQTKGVLQRRKFANFGAKNFGLFEIFYVFAQTRESEG